MATATATQTVPPLQQPRQPDISYAPDYAKYQKRRDERLRNEKDDLTKRQLPAGFPRELKSDLVWEGKDLAERYNWVFELTPEHIVEIDDALASFKALNKPLGYLTPQTFPLPTLHPHLRAISHELHNGHGFSVLRGLPVSRYTRTDNIAIYAGISSHIAPLRGRQDSTYQGRPASVVLTHIKDLSGNAQHAGAIGAPAYTADKQVFHTDAGDVVALFALSEAAEGGTSRLASTWRVYNELARTRPDLVATLAADWVAENFTTRGGAYHSRPLLYHQPATTKTVATTGPTGGENGGGGGGGKEEVVQVPERVVLQYARRYFTGYGALPRSASIPPITEAQAEALDALHFLGERFSVGLDFRKGDVQYVNNLAVFHARDAFTDTPEQQRHLLRLWLRDPEYAWETPVQHRDKWDQLYGIYPDDEDDTSSYSSFPIGLDPESEVFPLEPFVRTASNGQGKAAAALAAASAAKEPQKQ